MEKTINPKESDQNSGAFRDVQTCPLWVVEFSGPVFSTSPNNLRILLLFQPLSDKQSFFSYPTFETVILLKSFETYEK